ncbi:C-type lectin domain family 10 member A-like isoform X2 [Xyrauchen texanus]|uniref:C-type lectin domain family 10 member A-like isoform X2 n=1 Tax=Xyrauchen texanus TaxID=154827 RepID=UPI00224220C9|nr:C-type lectin domain family 10 member A-like isoform X2 [Xyrauchen texanus]
MLAFQKMESSEDIMTMEMECERKTMFRKGRPCDKKTGIFMFLGTVCVVFLTVMIFVLFSNLERKFSTLESWMINHNSNMTIRSESHIAECQQDVSYTDVKSLMVNLSNSVSALTSKLNDAVSKQEQKLTDTERLLDSFKSSVNSLQSDQQNNQRDFESVVSSLSVVKSSVSDLTSSVNTLSSKLQSTDGRVMNALNDLKTKVCAKTTDLPESNCKSGWISYLSSCYLFSRDKLNWSMARDYCEQQGALLLKIEEDNEWTFVTNITIPDLYWVGLTDQNTGQWRWADDTPYTMNKDQWNPGQPDDWTGHNLGAGEDCGQFTYTGKLNDNHCSVKMKYICKSGPDKKL